MSLQSSITKVVAVLKAAIMADYSVCKGIYENDQMSFSEYPVIIVGVPSLLDEDFPVIARQTVRDEAYTIEIVAYVKFEDTLASTREINTLTESIRTALRDDIKQSVGPLGGDSYQGEMGSSKFVFGAKGDILLRVSVTIVKYIQRI